MDRVLFRGLDLWTWFIDWDGPHGCERLDLKWMVGILWSEGVFHDLISPVHWRSDDRVRLGMNRGSERRPEHVRVTGIY